MQYCDGSGQKIIVRIEGLHYVDFANFRIALVNHGVFNVNDDTFMRVCIVHILKPTFFLSERKGSRGRNTDYPDVLF